MPFHTNTIYDVKYGVCSHAQFNNCTPKKGLHLEIFDPSRRMIEVGKAGSKLVAVVGDGGGDDDHILVGIG